MTRIAPLAAALAIGALACSTTPTPPDGGTSSSTPGSSGSTAGSTSAGASGSTGSGSGSGGSGGGFGAPCTASADCIAGGVCGVDGAGKGGHCCLHACVADPSGACGAVDCDSQGQCVYPNQTVACGAGPTCVDGGVATRVCSGQGVCAQARLESCPGDLQCAADGLGCLTSCQTKADCRPGRYCRGGSCVPQQDAGYCNSDDQCRSGICIGGGCCAAACVDGDAACAATSCDLSSGGCIYPDAGVPCGAASAKSCAGASLTAPRCDGVGGCSASASSQVCDGLFSCDARTTSCFTDCSDAGDVACAPAAACQNGACCTKPASGTTITVDAQGNDGVCCGSATQPCATITHAMDLIAQAKVQGAVIAVHVNKNPYNPVQYWTIWTGLEHYPIRLGWGVTLRVSDTEFDNLAGTIFEVAQFPEEGDGGLPVTIDGTPNSVIIGKDQNELVGIQVGSATGPGSVNLDQIQLGGSVVPLDVLPGSSATVNGLQFIPGGALFMRCRGTTQLPSALTVNSLNPLTQPITAGGIEVDGSCAVTLNRSNLTGNGDPHYRRGIQATGAASVALNASTVGNFFESGLVLQADDAGVAPTVQLTQSDFYANTCAAVYQRAGSLKATSSIFWGNGLQAVMLGAGTLDFSGSSDAGNVFLEAACGGGWNPGQCPAELPSVNDNGLTGAGLLNLSARGTIDLSGATFADNDAALGFWGCQDATLQSCSCGSGCASGDIPAAVALGSNHQAFTKIGINLVPSLCASICTPDGGGLCFCTPTAGFVVCHEP